jgi:hypothetical protein
MLKKKNRGGHTMKTVTLSLILFLLAAGTGFPARIGTLPQVLKPVGAAVDEDSLYVVEGATVSVYSLKDLRFVRKFGREGEGPGELKNTPFYVNKLVVLPGNIMLEGLDKIIFFSKQGKLEKEIKKKSLLIVQTLPIKNNFVVCRHRREKDPDVAYNCITLHNQDMEEIKDLYCMKHFDQGRPPSSEMDMLMDIPGFKVYDDKIFIEESPKGFVIEVFDSQGSKLSQIDKSYEKIKLSDSHKNEILDRFKSDPLIKRGGGWEQFKKTTKMIFPDTFPAIKNFEIANGRLYIQTYKMVEGKAEYVVTDLKGKLIKKAYLPRFQPPSLLADALGIKLHAIQKDKLYYLKENEENEIWELHVEEIK